MASEASFGPDFAFESDPYALASILSEEGITPASMARSKPQCPFRSGLTPAPKESLNARMRQHQAEYDFFEGKNGSVFYRPKPRMEYAANSADSMAKPSRGFGRNINLGIAPQRIGQRKSPVVLSAAKRRFNTERKMQPMVARTNVAGDFPALHRQSISERKAIPGLEDGVSARLGLAAGVGRPSLAKKSLFGSDNKAAEDSFEFAKPLSPGPPPPAAQLKSRAELIMMREGLTGLPRESLTALLRQSLSGAELDRMFEDDSTENFEALERRLKTPKRPTAASARKKKALSKTPKLLPPSAMKSAKKAETAGRVTFTDAPAVTPASEDKENKVPEASGLPEDIPKCDLQDEMDPASFLKSLGGVAADADAGTSAVTNPEVEKDVSEVVPHRKPVGCGLNKSFSTADLPRAIESEKKAEAAAATSLPVPKPILKSAISAVDLSDVKSVHGVELSSYHRKVVEELRQHDHEMRAIEDEMLSLMEKARARRERFREEWGVSPKSVNNLRSMKTVVTCVQTVDFSSAAESQPVPEAASAETEPAATKEFVEPVVSTEPTAEPTTPPEDITAAYDAVEDLIFHSATKEIDPEVTLALTEAENNCQVNLADAFDDILLDDEDMDITLEA